MKNITLLILSLMALACFSSCNDEGEENAIPQYSFFKPYLNGEVLKRKLPQRWQIVLFC